MSSEPLQGVQPKTLLAAFVNVSGTPIQLVVVTPRGSAEVTLTPRTTRKQIAGDPNALLAALRNNPGKELWRNLANGAFGAGVPLFLFGGQDGQELEFLDNAARALLEGPGTLPNHVIPIGQVSRYLESAAPMLVRSGVGVANLTPYQFGVPGRPARRIAPLAERTLPKGMRPIDAQDWIAERLPQGRAKEALGFVARGGGPLVVLADESIPLSLEAGEHPLLQALTEWQQTLPSPFSAWAILRPLEPA